MYKKVIAIVSFVGTTSASWNGMSFVIGQTYEIKSTDATKFIAAGVMIDFATALTNPKCPKIIRTTPIKI